MQTPWYQAEAAATATAGPAGSTTGRAGPPEVVLRGYPVRRGIRGREHTSALLRECALLAQGPGNTAPARLVAIAQQITAAYPGELGSADQVRTDAYLRGEATVDLRYPVPPGGRELLHAWRDALHELDAYAATSALLTTRMPADLRELQDWMLGELIRQSEGAPPRAWVGGTD